MKTIRCPRCKNMYEYEDIMPDACPECLESIRDEYVRVREYVKNHHGATISEVSRELKVPHAKIVNYLKQELLEIASSSAAASFLRCAVCGKVILTGVRCEECKKRPGYKVSL